ncbi:glycosyl transferase family 25 [Paraperlucidibaca baekdonensis]|uniref:Glycosyl transferase family 25 n=1 Tax=Paraperlucidibaca baekdonensis TaxID=748120 RepID=A0A3E0H7S2_9GAMM|nr:glycosyltransferase family 25 protein [Paraperlucidibaca baekdonensis]REH38866.1 glycosyl transferase family 25 [Paraperlucidibaca baekdonensis]
MPIAAWVINLPQARHRKAHIEAQQQALALPPCRWFSAIDGQALSKAEAEASICHKSLIRRAGRGFSLGELGCALSHRGIWQRFLASDEPYTLVLEDDAVLSEDLPAALPALEKHLASNSPRVVVLGKVRLYAQGSVKALTDAVSLMTPLRAWGGHAYLLNRAAAERMVQAQTPLRCMADDWVYFQRIAGVEVHGLEPYFADVLAVESQLEAERSQMRTAKPWHWRLTLRAFDRLWHKIWELRHALFHGPLRSHADNQMGFFQPCAKPQAEKTKSQK